MESSRKGDRRRRRAVDSPLPILSSRLGPSRRDFIRDSVLLGVTLPLTGAGVPRQLGVTELEDRFLRYLPEAPVTVTDKLLTYQDTCNVYAIRSGDSAILVDSGSGRILDLLPDYGVSRVEWILHTHHHRDQCQGDWRAADLGIKIAVPEGERFQFEQASDFWQSRRIVDLYNMQNDFSSLLGDLPVDRSLEDYGVFGWKDRKIEILPFPGHTPDSIALLTELDGLRIAFTGDLIVFPGRLHTLHDLQYNYAATDGIDLAVESLSLLLERQPDLLCPSHGPIIRKPVEALKSLLSRLEEWFRFYNPPSALLTQDLRLHHWSEHLVVQHSPEQLVRTKPSIVQHISPRLTNAGSESPQFYAILSDSGKTLLVDFGFASWSYFYSHIYTGSANMRARFVEHSLQELARRFQATEIDLCIPTHAHDENVIGVPYLQKEKGTRVYALDLISDVLEQPGKINLAGHLMKPISVDRKLADRERFEWEEFEFEIRHSPGHTYFQCCLGVEIDGEMVVFSGDAVKRVGQHLENDVVFRDLLEMDSYLNSLESIVGLKPTILAPTHGEPFAVTESDLREFRDRLHRQREVLEDLAADPVSERSLNPHWIRLEPFFQVAAAGETVNLALVVKNYSAEQESIEVALEVPSEWTSKPKIQFSSIDPGQTQKLEFRVTAEGSSRLPTRIPILADVILGDEYLGQVAHAMVFLEREK